MQNIDIADLIKGMQMPPQIAMGLIAHAGILGGKQSHASGGDILALRKAMQAAAQWVRKSSIGTQLQGQAFNSATNAGSDLAPLVPQDLSPVLHSVTAGPNESVLWPMLSRMGFEDATSHLHETNVLTNVLEEVDMGLAAGSAGANFEEQFARLVVQIKFYGRRFVIDDMAAMVGMTGFNGLVPRGALAVKTQASTLGLVNAMDLVISQSDSSCQPLQGDGLYRQILSQNSASVTWQDLTTGLRYYPAESGNYYDLRGAAVTPQFLVRRLGQLGVPPYYGYPDRLLMMPQVYQGLRNQAIALTHYNDVNRPNADAYFAPGGDLYIAGPRGPVKCVSVPHLVRSPGAPATAIGDAPPPSTFASTPATIAAGAAVSNSQFAAADAGAYFYRVVAVGDRGQTAAATIGTAVTVAAGQAVTIHVKELSAGATQGATADTATTGAIRYFRVYRSDKDGLVGTAKHIGDWPVNTVDVGVGTVIVDENYRLPACSPIIAVEENRSKWYWANLLGMIRRPLGTINTTIAGILMLFGAMHCRAPSQMAVFDNASHAG